MQKITSAVGNIYSDLGLQQKFLRRRESGDYEVLELSRSDMEKHQIRKTTNKGTDLGIVLDHGVRLKHGDVLDSESMIVIEQTIEKVAAISLGQPEDPHQLMEMYVLVGHTIGNMHRPVSVHRGRICFPIRSETEIDVFKHALYNLVGNAKFEVDEIRFMPHDGTSVHEH